MNTTLPGPWAPGSYPDLGQLGFNDAARSITVASTPELGFVKLRDTPGTVEVHWDVLDSSGSYTRAGDFTSDFSPADADNGVWQPILF